MRVGRGLVDRKLVEAPSNLIAGRPKAALLFWLLSDFRCGVLLSMVILVIQYINIKIRKNSIAGRPKAAILFCLLLVVLLFIYFFFFFFFFARLIIVVSVVSICLYVILALRPPVLQSSCPLCPSFVFCLCCLWMFYLENRSRTKGEGWSTTN